MISARTVDRLSRILALIPFVLERHGADVQEVLERFDYTEAQLARDLDTVFVCGLPGYGPGDLMEAYIDEDEVIIDAAEYFTRAPRLTPAEALGLLAAGMTAIEMGAASKALSSAVAKLSAVVVPDAGQSLSVSVGEGSEQATALREAAAGHRVVRITYRSVGREETTTREIEPWSVFTTLGRWYVTGRCRLVDDQRTFRIDRIKDLEPLDELFEPPDELPEPRVSYTPSPEDVTCVIDLSPAARWVLDYYPVEVLRESSRSIRIRFSSPDTEVPARLLLRLGHDARLVEGAEVAERTRQLGELLLARYPSS
ncbi:MAG: WYL domain-containing protein [Actinobacteria bacterium]|nr:WYL domain-containing protein [Actinomycetota bacterium]